MGGMNGMKLLKIVAVMTLVSLLVLGPSPASAQAKQPIDPQQMGQSGDGPVVVIGFSDGRWLTATAERGISGVIGLRAREAVSVQLNFPANFAGQRIVAESLDGGSLTADQPASAINSDGTVNLTFQAGALPGLNRVAVRVAGKISLLRFWVLDPKNSLAHPPLLSTAQ